MGFFPTCSHTLLITTTSQRFDNRVKFLFYCGNNGEIPWALLNDFVLPNEFQKQISINQLFLRDNFQK